MALQIISLPRDSEQNPFFTQLTSFDGIPYRLNVSWNHRLGRWLWDLYDEEDVPVVTGRTLIANWDMLKDIGTELRPKGQLIYFSANGQDPTLTTLSQGTFYYEPADD